MTSRRVTACVAAIGLLALGACASAARPEAMSVPVGALSVAQPNDPGYRAIRVVEVTGGGDTNALWLSNVSNAEFRQALQTSLDTAQLFDGRETAPMALSASLIDLQRPLAGIDLTVVSRVRYSVTDRAGAVVFDDTVAASGTAGLSDALMATDRLRMANEASIRENIRTFIERFRARPAR